MKARTVAYHKYRMMEVLGAKSSAELISALSETTWWLPGSTAFPTSNPFPIVYAVYPPNASTTIKYGCPSLKLRAFTTQDCDFPSVMA